MREIIGIIDADPVANFFNRNTGELQILAFYLNFDMIEIFKRQITGLFLK